MRVKRIWRFLLSRGLAVSAIAATAALLALATLVPDPSEPAFEAMRQRHPLRAAVLERLDLGRLTRSPAFLVLPGFIGLSVAASMWQRTRARLRSQRDGPVRLERFVVRRTVRVRGDATAAAARIEEALARAGFPRAAVASGPVERHGDRGALGFAGSMLFHAALLVTLSGIALSAIGRFTGELLLTEGFAAAVDAGSMVSASPPEGLRGLTGVRLTARDVAVEYVRDADRVPSSRSGMVEIGAVLDVERDGAPPVRTSVGVNAPASVVGYQLSLHRYGFAPEVGAVDPAGRVRADAIALLEVLPPGVEDTVALDGGGELRLSLYPDFVLRDGRPTSRSARDVRPVLAWRWLEGGRVVAAGRVERGGESDVGGYRVAFPSLQHWVGLVVSKDPGLPWFAAGALLGVAGLTLRLVGHERAWTASLRAHGSATDVEVALSARYFPALLAERADRVWAALSDQERDG